MFRQQFIQWIFHDSFHRFLNNIRIHIPKVLFLWKLRQVRYEIKMIPYTHRLKFPILWWLIKQSSEIVEYYFNMLKSKTMLSDFFDWPILEKLE